MQLPDSEIFIVTKIRGYTYIIVDIEKERVMANDETTVSPTPKFIAVCSFVFLVL